VLNASFQSGKTPLPAFPSPDRGRYFVRADSYLSNEVFHSALNGSPLVGCHTQELREYLGRQTNPEVREGRSTRSVETQNGTIDARSWNGIKQISERGKLLLLKCSHRE
jgi:hypothetical protein